MLHYCSLAPTPLTSLRHATSTRHSGSGIFWLYIN